MKFLLKKENQSLISKKPIIHVIAQSHIDLAWKWRFHPETTQVCCKLTFGLATDNLDKFKEYRFSQSQVPLYTATETYHPQIYEKILKYIKEGRWEIVGAMYVEAEGGEPCGESLVRQCIHGKIFFQKYGIEVTTGWQEDSWSHPWQLPQIYKKCGVDIYFFKRGIKDPELFWWESPDGSKILAIKPVHLLTNAVRLLDRFALMLWIRKNIQKYKSNHVMVRIGCGDHGGGPKPQDILKVLKMAKSKARKYNIAFDTFGSYRDAVIKENLKINTLKYEIGCELQGDLTNCSELKKNNRLCENLLMNSEKFTSLAYRLFNLSYPVADFNQMWESLLFNQFHDIIGGSAIPEANEDASILYDFIKNMGKNIFYITLGSITKNIDTNPSSAIGETSKNLSALIVFNPLSWNRQDLIETSISLKKENPIEKSFVLLDYLGNIIPYQIVDRIEEENVVVYKIIFEANVPSLGFTVFYISNGHEKPQDTLEDLPYFEGNILENKFYKIVFDITTGNIFQIYDKLNNFMVFNSENRGNSLVAIEDYGDSEGKFKQGNDYSPKPFGKRFDISFSSESLIYGSNIKIVEKGPIRWRIQLVKEYENSQFVQEIILYRSIQRIDFAMTIDWHETHKMIKLLFPTSINQPIITYDSAYCPIERHADGNEYPTQKFVDISNGKCGVALINEGKYANDVQNSTIGMSVLRSPTEPANNNEEGLHYFRYALYPHGGDFKSANVMQKAYEFNNELIPYQTDLHSGTLQKNHAFIETPANNVIFEVMKKAFDSDALILRLYEFHGKSGVVKINLSFEVNSCSETDLLENEIKSIPLLKKNMLEINMEPYEIKTLKLK